MLYSRVKSFINFILLLQQIKELNVLEKLESGVRIGAGTSLHELEKVCTDIVENHSTPKTKIFQVLLQALKNLASPQTRNVATIGGHIQWAHACSDLNPIFMVGNCQIEILRNGNKP